MSIERTLLSISAERSTLHGTLEMPLLPKGIVVFVETCAGENATRRETADALHLAGFGTLVMDLLQFEECQFADASTHLPHLTERLLTILSHLRRQMTNQVLPELPIGLIAWDDATPVAVRAAAIRDEDVRAVVCHGGLVDLAGLQYLRVLQAPLLLLADSAEAPAAINARRASSFIPTLSEVKILSPDGLIVSQVVEQAAAWFVRHLHGAVRAAG